MKPTNTVITRETVEEIREDIIKSFPDKLPFARCKEDHKSVVEAGYREGRQEMRDNRYAVEAIKDEAVPLEVIEKNLRFKMLQKLEGVLFSGEMVAIKISKEELPGNWYSGLIRYQAEVKQVRQVEYVHVPPASRKPERQPMKKEGIIRRAARKVHKALGDFIRDNNGGK